MLSGRLGLEKARIPHADRHGVIMLRFGRVSVEDGCLRFVQDAGEDQATALDFAIPYQTVSCLVLEPGTSVTHDAVRLLARHGTGLVFCGMGGTRVYSAPPLMPDSSAIARMQARAWSDVEARNAIARAMYKFRFGEMPPPMPVEELRGMEAARMRAAYGVIAKRFGIDWKRRDFDRDRPTDSDEPNQAVNHAASAVYACATVGTYAVAAIPQLGFLHEDSGHAFVLDVADMFRTTHTLAIAFGGLSDYRNGKTQGGIERAVRNRAAKEFSKTSLVTLMIDAIKGLFPCP